jgi:hypothetical protein
VEDLLKSLGDQVESDLKHRAARHSRTYRCRCNTHVFFDNTQCLSCLTPLGFLPDEGRLAALLPGPQPETWLADGRDPHQLLKFCANRDSPALCNWMLLAGNPQQYCMACRLNRTIPFLGDPVNARYWSKIEAAKRRLISQLIALGLPVRSKVTEDPERGLMFDFLRSQPGEEPVITGHASGLITINAEEADDAKREQIKHDLHEPYRTLLGHFRHEVGHYYWDRLIRGTRWHEPFRKLFGDERASYAQALEHNYEVGPPPDWANAHISAYATSHPWEDWAETWAHFLHVVDSLGTAMGFGLEAQDIEGQVRPFTADALYAPNDPRAGQFLSVLNGWVEMMMVLNELARSLGQPDFYPFVMSRPVVAKLQFIQIVVRDAQSNPSV